MFYGIKLIQDNRNKGKIRWSYIYLPSFFSIFSTFFRKNPLGGALRGGGTACRVRLRSLRMAFGYTGSYSYHQCSTCSHVLGAIRHYCSPRGFSRWSPPAENSKCFRCPAALPPTGLLRQMASQVEVNTGKIPTIVTAHSG